MDLIERYVAAVGRQLPDKQAADIENELRDVLMSRQEEQEEQLGRPLTRVELESLLIDFGHPLTVAGRYRRTQHLIGPEVFPFWWAAIKVMLMAVAGAYLVLIIIGILTDQTPAQFNRGVPSAWYVAIYPRADHLVCMLIERFGKARVLNAGSATCRRPAASGARPRDGRRDVATWCSSPGERTDPLQQYHSSGHLRSTWPVWATCTGRSRLLCGDGREPDAWRGRAGRGAAILSARYLAGVAIRPRRADHCAMVRRRCRPDAMEILQKNVDLGMRTGSLHDRGDGVPIALSGGRLRRALKRER